MLLTRVSVVESVLSSGNYFNCLLLFRHFLFYNVFAPNLTILRNSLISHHFSRLIGAATYFRLIAFICSWGHKRVEGGMARMDAQKVFCRSVQPRTPFLPLNGLRTRIPLAFAFVQLSKMSWRHGMKLSVN